MAQIRFEAGVPYHPIVIDQGKGTLRELLIYISASRINKQGEYHIGQGEDYATCTTKEFGGQRFFFPEDRITPLRSGGVDLSELRLKSYPDNPTYKAVIYPSMSQVGEALKRLPDDFQDRTLEIIERWYPTVINYDGCWKILQTGLTEPRQIYSDADGYSNEMADDESPQQEETIGGRIIFKKAIRVGKFWTRDGMKTAVYVVVGMECPEMPSDEAAIRSCYLSFFQTFKRIQSGDDSWRDMGKFAKPILKVNILNPYA